MHDTPTLSEVTFQFTRSLERDSAVSPNDETHASFQLTHS